MSTAIATGAAAMRAAAYSCVLFVLAVVSETAAADNLPGDYLPLPAGTRVLGLRYTYATGGDLHSGGDLVDEDFDFIDQQGLLTFNYYGGRRLRWLFSASQPFGRTEIDSDRLALHDSDTGIGDPYFVLGVVPLIRDKYSVGFSGWLFVPLGDYAGDNVINQGMNAWSVRTEANVTFRPSAAWTLELTTGARVRPGLQLSLDYFWHGGNETTVNGVERDDTWNDHAAQVTALWQLQGRRLLTVYYRNDLVVRSGPENQSVAVRFMQGF